MLEVKCKYCEKIKRVKPADVKDPNNYHCRECHTIYLKEKKENGLMTWNRTALNKINNMAMMSGHKSIFSNGKNLNGTRPVGELLQQSK